MPRTSPTILTDRPGSALAGFRRDRRARCWGRIHCPGEPVILLWHRGETEPFAACGSCAAGLLTFSSFSLWSDVA